MNPHVYIVIPVYNRISYTRKCLECLGRQTWKTLKVIVVDDGSIDGTSHMIRENFPKVKLFTGDGNLWWTGAINVGIRYALQQMKEGDFILTLNDDLEVDDDYVEQLVSFAMAHPGSLVGSVVVDINRPEIIQNGGVIINLWTAKKTVLNSGKKLASFGDRYFTKVSTLTGRGTLIPMEVFSDIGLYDEKHFQQCGDTELPLRAAAHGMALFVSYGAVVKSHLDGGDRMNVGTMYRLCDAKEYFFGIKSNMCLRYRFFFARSISGKKIQRFLTYFTMDVLRITYHFVRRLRFTN